MDLDDYIEKSYIGTLYSLMIDDDNDLGICTYYEFSDMGVVKTHGLNSLTADTLSGNVFDDYCILEERLFFSWSKIYKLDIIRDNNIFFPEDMVTAEDQVFNYMYLSHVKKYKYLNRYQRIFF